MEEGHIQYKDTDEAIESLTCIETERFRKIFEQRGFEEGLLTVGRVIALYRVLAKHHQAHEEEMAGLQAQIDALEKPLIFSRGEEQGRLKAARLGGNARSAKYAAMKSAALTWYAENRNQHQNKNDAALALTKIHSVEFGTARAWLKGV